MAEINLPRPRGCSGEWEGDRKEKQLREQNLASPLKVFPLLVLIPQRPQGCFAWLLFPGLTSVKRAREPNKMALTQLSESLLAGGLCFFPGNLSVIRYCIWEDYSKLSQARMRLFV